MTNIQKTEFGIYGWFNLVNGKVLIGQTGSTKGFLKRKSNYLSFLKRNKWGNKHFQNAWNKYGEDNFEFRIVEKLNNDNVLTQREQYWVNFYRETGAVYNKIGPVDAPMKGVVHTDETKAKMRKAHLGKTLSEEAKRKLSIAKTGMKISDEERARLKSIAPRGKLHKNYGKPATDKLKAAISLANSRMILVIDLNTFETSICNGIRSAMQLTGASHKQVILRCVNNTDYNNYKKFFKEYYFEYLKEVI